MSDDPIQKALSEMGVKTRSNPLVEEWKREQEVKRPCSFWTAFFECLPRFAITAVPIGIITIACIYGAFYCTGFVHIIGWLALVIGSVLGFMLVTEYVVICFKLRNASREVLEKDL
jgi:hypothetical protein